MLVIPAIDLKDGKCVRLKQGRMEEDTVFSDNPVAMAKHWVDAGAQRLHVVDLNGAFAGKPVNGNVIRQVVQAYPELDIQVGGGIRELDTIQEYLDQGVNYVILGTKAVTMPHFVANACTEFPERIIVGLDARDGKLATDGWSKLSHHSVVDMAKRFEQEGVNAIVYTDISRDGMMQGVNIKATVDLACSIQIPVIASGGIHNLQDIQALCEVAEEGIMGVITGRAIYEGSLDFAQAQQLASNC